MGIDVTLCPERYAEDNWFLAYDRVGTERDYDLQQRLRALPFEPLSTAVLFEWYGADGLYAATEDLYGHPLRCIRAGVFREFTADGLSNWNRGVIRMMQELEPDTRVVLWWH